MTQNLPDLNPIPADIENHIRRLLSGPHDAAVGEWLLELIKNSGHKSSSDDLRWRTLVMLWLAMEYDTDAAWPYLMWLNTNEAHMSTHFSEIFSEAIDIFAAHVKLANWQAQNSDERLVTFLQEFHCLPAQRYIPSLFSQLLTQPTRPEIGLWLKQFCEDTAANDNLSMRPWRLLTAAWYAAAFDSSLGLTNLKTLSNNAATLSHSDNKLLLDAANDCNGQVAMMQLLATCPDEGVKMMLKEFGHPHLPTLVTTILDSPPDYAHPEQATSQATFEVLTFRHNLTCLEQAHISPKNGHILDLACGPLASQTLLLSSAGYKTLGVGLELPPGDLPLPGLKAWFKRNKHRQAWQEATAAYYQILGQQAEMPLKWKKATLKLADLTRLKNPDNSFEAVICTNYLQHAPDINSLLSEAARVLKPGGLFLATICPFAALNGALQIDSASPWSHLVQDNLPASGLIFNKWRETQFQEALAQHFTIKQWLPEIDPQAQTYLTPEIRQKLTSYSDDELTRQQIKVIATK